ncbi:hypothetical protein C3486_30655 [Streptomyces sp. Ru73]|uniref:hypothetical protein n=1 Tax=Streptomyces sp. Ru73 TaxID=2080748 RepID=UPI000CDDFBAB|nr:hypothetical protein [Streptomyces sp. Ru73]POX37006.1 hypothetical protein C3486_30655 [Streptomyces sp. Ru73]
MDEVRRALRQAAAAHRPDRERMRARVERGMAAPERPAQRRTGRAAPWLRVAGATAAVAGVLAAGGYGVTAVFHGPDRGGGRSLHAGPPAPTAAPSHGPAPATGGAPRASRTADGPLWSDGSVDPHSNDYWAQSNVTLQTAEPLTSLTVELRVARTEGVRPTGAWRTLPARDFTFTTTSEDGFLVYRWTLKDGRTVPAGRHVFAGQYDHAHAGRDAGADTYTATARSGGERAAVRGDFAPHGR